MWNLEETSKERLLVLRKLMLSYEVLVLRNQCVSLKFIQLLRNLKRLLMFFQKSIVGTMLFLKRTISTTDQKLHKPMYDYLCVFMKEELHFIMIILLLSVWPKILLFIRVKHPNLLKNYA